MIDIIMADMMVQELLPPVYGYQEMNGVLFRLRTKTMDTVMVVIAGEVEYQDRMVLFVSGVPISQRSCRPALRVRSCRPAFRLPQLQLHQCLLRLCPQHHHVKTSTAIALLYP